MNMKALLVLCAVTVAAAATYSMAWAQTDSDRPAGPPGRPGGGPRPFGPTPEEMDANADGVVTKAEFTTAWNKALEAQFKRLDADSNGVLSQEELEKARPPRPRGGAEMPPWDQESPAE